jgi:hypothetical protein
MKYDEFLLIDAGVHGVDVGQHLNTQHYCALDMARS